MMATLLAANMKALSLQQSDDPTCLASLMESLILENSVSGGNHVSTNRNSKDSEPEIRVVANLGAMACYHLPFSTFHPP